MYRQLVADGLGPLLPEWTRYSHLTGRRVTIDCAGRRHHGIVRGLDRTGRLVLDGSEGEARIIAGDVTVVDASAGLPEVRE